MKKSIFLILFINVFANCYSQEMLWNFFNNQEYSKICSNEVWSKDYFEYNDDEEFVNMYAYSCMQTDMINRLTSPIVQLRKSKKSRANALYYATILYQKKILYHALIDGIEQIPTNLPNTDYILSKIYDKFSKKDFTKKQNAYYFSIENIDYKLFSKKDSDGYEKIVLQTIKNNEIIKTRLYW